MSLCCMYVCVRVIILFVYWTVVLLRHPRGVQAEERSCTLGVPTLSLVRYYFRLYIFVLSLFYIDLGSRVTNSLNSKTSNEQHQKKINNIIMVVDGWCIKIGAAVIIDFFYGMMTALPKSW